MRQAVDLARAAAGVARGWRAAHWRGRVRGREFLARLIHAWGHRPDAAVGACTAWPIRRSWRIGSSASRRTGSRCRRRPGPDGSARRGVCGPRRTLFLDALVAAPARAAGEGVPAVTGWRALLIEKRLPVDLDFRLMAAVEPDVEAALADGRLAVISTNGSRSWRSKCRRFDARREDIPALGSTSSQRTAAGARRIAAAISRAALALLSALPWPGNATELRALVETLVRSGRPGRDSTGRRPWARAARWSLSAPRRQRHCAMPKARFERDWISAMLMKHQGRVEDAARALGINGRISIGKFDSSRWRERSWRGKPSSPR